MRVKIIRGSNNYRLGEVLDIDSVLAYKLIEQGVAESSKDMAPADYKVKNGNTSRLRTNHRR
jgi:hypothetical protein